MSYIRFEHKELGNARWLDATPEAFVVHAWALDYCNEQATDGEIPTKIAHRLNCPVEPIDLPAAWDDLVNLEIWTRRDGSYVCPGFLSYGIAASEQTKTRDKWAEDKRRRRLCSVGNHDLCTERSKCKAVKAVSASTSGKVDVSSAEKWTTKPDQTPKEFGNGGGAVVGRPAMSAACPDCQLPGGKHVHDCEFVPKGQAS